MPYTTNGNKMVLSFRDIRNQGRTREVQLGGLVIVTDDDAADFSGCSKSVVRRYVQKNEQIDVSLVPDSDSEVNDTLRLYFLMPDDTRYHLDIVDPNDDLFLETEGAGALVAKSKTTLEAATTPAPEFFLNNIIEKVLDGSILISDGETPVAYLEGLRI